MGRTKIWDGQFAMKWAVSWISRLKAVAAASEEDVASVARGAIEREIKRREKRLGIGGEQKQRR